MALEPGAEAIPGAVEAVAALRAQRLRLRFVTNTTSRPRREILARLERLGIPLAADELVTPAHLPMQSTASVPASRAPSCSWTTA